MFLHIIVGQDSKKSNSIKLTFFSHDVMLKHICPKTFVTMY
jgi:hypothetical protein